ncbi:hypothetical protein A2U01_0115946, partial [Trifolium medium]|nr:hypothetical protein [Trifolium medium]
HRYRHRSRRLHLHRTALGLKPPVSKQNHHQHMTGILEALPSTRSSLKPPP